jgi:hypothetical protein
VRRLIKQFRQLKLCADSVRAAHQPLQAGALHFLYYNFVRIHKTLKVTPAMAAGVTDRLWEVADMVSVLEAWEAV